MELIIIDETKLKIMLTPPDMRHYELNADRMSTANAATRRAFRHIFDDARERIGFDTSGERLLVQLYTSRGGGCEIFVTKLGADTELDALTSFPKAAESEKTTDCGGGISTRPVGERALLERLGKEEPMSNTAVRSVYAAPPAEAETHAFAVTDAEALFALCRRLAAVGYDGASAVYIVERGRETLWYLFLTPTAGKHLPCFADEYARRLDETDSLSLYLAEHGRVLCKEDAVGLLGNV